MNSKTKNTIKWVAIRVFILIIFLFGLVFYGGYLMDIEDRYGDLQDLYWESEDGDVVFNKLNSTSAIIEKDWHRIYVKIDKKSVHLDEWLDPNNKYNYDVALYRPNESLENVQNLKSSEIEKRIRNSSIELITELKIKY